MSDIPAPLLSFQIKTTSPVSTTAPCSVHIHPPQRKRKGNFKHLSPTFKKIVLHDRSVTALPRVTHKTELQMHTNMVAALHQDWKETLANETFVCYRKNDVKRSEFLEESSLCFCLVMESYKSRKRRHFPKLLILFIADSSPDAISHGSLFRREKKNGGCLKAL